MKNFASVLMGLLLSSPTFTDSWESHDSPELFHSSKNAIQSVADIDGSGWVTYRDLKLAYRAFLKGEYIAFFDRDANGELDIKDVKLVRRDLGKKVLNLIGS